MGTRHSDHEASTPATRYDPLLEKAAEFYHRTLQREGEGFDVLRRHRLTEDGLIERFGIGYCDGRLLRALPDEDTVRTTLLRLGILEETDEDGASHQERLLDCLVFPLHDLDNGLVSLFGLPLTAAKPILLPNGPGLWNLPAAANFPTLMICLTLYDALSLYIAGFANTIAIVAELPRESDIDLLERSGVQQLHLVGHQPLSAQLTQTFGTLASYFRKLPESPNRILLKKGAEELAAMLEASARVEIISPTASGPMEILEGGFVVVLGIRRYEIRGLDKSRLKLKATIRVEHSGRLHVDSVDFLPTSRRPTGSAIPGRRRRQEMIEQEGGFSVAI